MPRFLVRPIFYFYPEKIINKNDGKTNEMSGNQERQSKPSNVWWLTLGRLGLHDAQGTEKYVTKYTRNSLKKKIIIFFVVNNKIFVSTFFKIL